MRLTFITLAALWLMAAIGEARAQQGYVVEALEATPDVGAALDEATPLSIQPGGHIVIMTRGARMVRRDGPFQGPARDLLEVPPGTAGAGEPLAKKLLLGLSRLVEESGASEDTAFGVRGAVPGATDGEAGSYAIVPGTRVFCLHDDARPAFFTADPPALESKLIVRRITRPKVLLRTAWPAGARRLDWPDDWPPPAKGRYLAAIGESGGWALRLIPVGPRPEAALRQAALYYEAGCRHQALAALRLAVDEAGRD